MLDSGWFDVGWEAGECLAVGVKLVAPLIGESFERLSGGLRAADRLVIDIC